MFFNYDILFRNGPLALVWLAGNETLKNKNNGVHKKAVLRANVTDLCGTIRNLIPQMGTAHGIPLKKMGTLAKGITIMYSIRIEHFARDVMQANIALRRPVTFDPTTLTKREAKAKVTFGQPTDLGDEDEIQMNITFGFEDIEFFGCSSPRRRYEEGVDSFSELQVPSDGMQEIQLQRRDLEAGKRNLRKRSRGEREEDVIARLASAFEGIDPRANTLFEDVPLPDEPQQQDLDLDFGDGLALLNAGETADQIHLPAQDNENVPPTVVDETTGFCPGEDALLPPTEVTVNEGIVPENTRKRRATDGREELDKTILELPELEAGDAETPRRGKRARRRLGLQDDDTPRRGKRRFRLGLQVDEKTSFSLEEMLSRIEASDMASLQLLLDSTRAPGKSLWGLVAHYDKTALNLITTAGRPCKCIALNEMRANIMKKAAELPPREEHHRNVAGDSANQNGGVSSVFGEVEKTNQTSDIQGPNGGEISREHQLATSLIPGQSVASIGVERTANVDPLLEQQECPLEQVPPAPAANEFDEGMGEYQDPFVVPQAYPDRGDEQVIPRRGKTFEEMYPPDACTRRRAASGFLHLLKMQAKTVSMHQENSFGRIDVRKLK